MFTSHRTMGRIRRLWQHRGCIGPLKNGSLSVCQQARQILPAKSHLPFLDHIKGLAKQESGDILRSFTSLENKASTVVQLLWLAASSENLSTNIHTSNVMNSAFFVWKSANSPIDIHQKSCKSSNSDGPLQISIHLIQFLDCKNGFFRSQPFWQPGGLCRISFSKQYFSWRVKTKSRTKGTYVQVTSIYMGITCIVIHGLY